MAAWLCKKLLHHSEWHLEAHLSQLVVLFNVLLDIAGTPTRQQMPPALKDFALSRRA